MKFSIIKHQHLYNNFISVNGYKTKRCNKCDKYKPHHFHYFAKNKNNKDGFNYTCKECRNSKPLRYITPEYKLCNKCNISKLCNEYFYRKDSGDITGFTTICKECALKYERDPIVVSRRSERNQHKSEYYRKYYAKQCSDNTNTRLRYRLYTSKRRALKQKLNETFTVQDIKLVKERFEHKCFVCSSTERLEIDHFFPLSMGYVLTHQNAVLLCKSCNCSKTIPTLMSGFRGSNYWNYVKHMVYVELVHRLRLELRIPILKVWCLNHWAIGASY